MFVYASLDSGGQLLASVLVLTLDYGKEEAERMVQAFPDADKTHLLGVLNWPGVAKRWRAFLDWSSAVSA